MWPFGKQSARRKEIRRSKAERGQRWFARLLAPLVLWPSVVTVAAGVVAAVVVNLGGDVLDIRAGQVVPRAITSRVEFSVENVPRTIEMRGRAREHAENHYELDVSLLRNVRGRLTNALELAKEHAADPERFQEETRRARLVLDEAGRSELLRIGALTDTQELRRAVDRFQDAVDEAVTRLAFRPRVQLLVEAGEPSQSRSPVNAILVDPGDPSTGSAPQQRLVSVAKLLYSNRPEAAETVAETAAQAFSSPLRASMKASIQAMLRGEAEGTVKPIYRYLPEESDRAAQEAYDRVKTQYDTYGRDRLLANAGVITEDEYRLLRSEREAYRQWVASGGRPLSAEEEARLREEDPERLRADQAAARAARLSQRLSAVGYALLALLVTFGVAYHLLQARPGFRLDLLRQLLAVGVLLGLLSVARLVYVGTATPSYVVGVQAVAATLLVIVCVRGPAIALGGSLALLITLSTRQGVGFFLVLLAVSMMLVFGLRVIRSRGKIVGVGAAAGLLALGTTLATGLIHGQTLAFVFWQQALPAGGTTLAAAFIVEGVLPGIERLFKISTSMSLLERCDASKPLLRMLAAEAPGTYNHSLLVGALAEAAAEAVGADGLLARTGAYYHDIGKINKPEYFTENRAFGVSRHDRLSPAMSHLIIIGHVKDGIEMAREYGLPASLHPFIAQHHGTTLVQYFYHAASQQRKPGEREVSDVEFRYAGPKPQTRETAIVMVCDGVEGAVRAMPEPTPGRIEDVVTKVAQQRLMDGQLDECDLTFRELESIERSLVKSLCAIYHSRIAYPAGRDEERKTAESAAS